MKFTDFNTKSTIAEEINIEENEFIKLADYADKNKTATVKGFFFTDGDYGKQVVVVGNGWLINMPKRATEQFEAIIKNEDMLNAVLGGHLALTDIKPIKTNTGDTTSYTFTEI